MSKDSERAPREGPHESRPRRSGSLCPACAHVRLITSAKGSTFLLCELSMSDIRYTKYPPQPVVHCGGFEERGT
jgi:hypothetical protein